MSFKSLLLLFSLLALIASCLADLSDGFRKVNKFLLKKSLKGERNVDDYMASLQYELSQSKLKRFSPSSSYELALVHLNKLEIISNSIKCEPYEQELLAEAAQHCDGHRFVDESEMNSLSSVSLIVHDVSLKRAKHCEEVWPKMFQEVYANMSPSTKRGAEYKRTALASIRAEKTNDNDYIDYLVNYKFFEDQTRIQDAYSHIVQQFRRSLANETSSDRLENNEEKRSAEFDKYIPPTCDFDIHWQYYLEKHCTRYSRELGDPILGQKSFDALMSKGSEGFSRDPKMIPSYEALVNYKACQHVSKSWFKSEVYEFWVGIQVNEKTVCYWEFMSAKKTPNINKEKRKIWLAKVGLATAGLAAAVTIPVWYPIAVLGGAYGSILKS